jgi:hypothetical protein
MGYRVIITKNGEYKKTLYRSRTLESSKNKFEDAIDENEASVRFPRKFLSDKGITPVEYRIYLVKDYEEGDEPRLVRDSLGRLITEGPIFDIWTVIDDYPYQYEETFYVYGFDSRHDRKDIRFIMTLMMKGIQNKELTKSIVVLHNKIIIYNEHQFDIVFCKCIDDAVRLYDILMSTAKSMTFKRLMFMGQAGDILTGELYEMMMDVTGWDYRRVTRTATST